MNNLTEQLKDGLSQLSFMIPTIDSADDKLQAHRLVVDLLVIAGQLHDQHSSASHSTAKALSSTNSVAEEVNKVKRRLKLWANRPHQINTQLLKAFISLESKGTVFVDDLAKAIDDPSKFSTNFNQMCIIAPNNHGKIFEVNQGQVSIWPPITDLVENFKEATES